jgi:nicotinamidase-related amidase
MGMKSTLLLLDLQNDMVSPSGKIGAHGLAAAAAAGQVIDHAATALAAARAVGMTVIHVRLGFAPDYSDCLSVAPRIATLKANGAAIVDTWGTEFPAELAPASDELVITKKCVNPFFNTPLLDSLHEKRIERLYFGGVATHLVVEMTARAADDAGFAPVVLADLCAAPSQEMHAFSLERIIPMFGRVASSVDFCREASDQAASE